jgi:hypothetical protein
MVSSFIVNSFEHLSKDSILTFIFFYVEIFFLRSCKWVLAVARAEPGPARPVTSPSQAELSVVHGRRHEESARVESHSDEPSQA